MFRARPFHLGLQLACRRLPYPPLPARRELVCATPPAFRNPPRDDYRQTITEGPSWVTIIPEHVSQSPRHRSHHLRTLGHFREAHAVLRHAGIPHSRHPNDLLEYLSVLQQTDEFPGPHQRLNTMLNAIWSAPTRKPKKAFRILLNACVQEASTVSDNSVVKLNEIQRITQIAWQNLRNFNGRKQSPVNQTTIALIYRICGYCRALDLADRVRRDINDPIVHPHHPNTSATEHAPEPAVSSPSDHSQDTLAEFILCLGKCGKPVDAERLFYSHHNRVFRSSPRVLAALFQAYLAANRISKAEALISVHGASFLDLNSCNAFLKQCTAVRLFDTALTFLDRMERHDITGFPHPVARTYNILLHGLSSVQALDQCDDDFEATASDLVMRMKHHNIQPTTVTYNTLIKSYIIRGKVADAMVLFRSMDRPDHITFSHLMQGACNVGDADIGNGLIDAIQAQAQRPTYGFCKSYLHLSASVHGVDYAVEQARFLVANFSNVFIFGDVGAEEAIRMALIHACGKVGDLPGAFKTLSLTLGPGEPASTTDSGTTAMARRNSYYRSSSDALAPLYVATVLMQACLDCGREGQALEVFDSLKTAGLTPNFEVYESLIKGLCQFVKRRASSEHEHRAGSSSNRADAWIKAANYYDDEEVSEDNDGANATAEESEFGESESDLSAVFGQALQLVRDMHQSGAARTTRQVTYMYNQLIMVASEIGEFELAFEVFRRMAQVQGQAQAQAQRQEEIKRHGEWPELEGCDQLPPASVNTYNAMMGAAWKCSRASEALLIFERMQMDRETEPNETTLGLLADIGMECREQGTVEKILLELDRIRMPERIGRKRAALRKKVITTRYRAGTPKSLENREDPLE